MTRILVTGATGNLGRLTLEELLGRQSTDEPTDIAALARHPGALSNLAARGVDVRQGDYFDQAALRTAMTGVDRLLLVSAPAFTDRAAAHLNVIDAARQAGVGRVLYTSVQGHGTYTLSQVTDSDNETLDALASSGMQVSVAYNSLFLDSLLEMIGDEPATRGTLTAPAGDGKVAPVARRDLARSYAAVLTADHPLEAYTLTGPQAVTMDQMAAIIGRHLGKVVAYRSTSVDAYVADRKAADVPSRAATFFAEWFTLIAEGVFQVSTDMGSLVQHPATSVAEFLSRSRSRG